MANAVNATLYERLNFDFIRDIAPVAGLMISGNLSPKKELRMATAVTPHPDRMYMTAIHEAGHAVAYVLAFRALGRHWAAFDRVLIRRDASSPHIDRRGRSVECVGMLEAADIYSEVTGVSEWRSLPTRRPQMTQRMEWDIVTTLAGPFAEAAALGDRTKSGMRFTALFCCGGEKDYIRAERVLQDYKQTTRSRRGLRHFEDRVRDLVLTAWPAIEALALALLVSDELDYEEAAAVIAGAEMSG